MIAAQKSTVGLAKPGPKIGSDEEPNYKPTLAEAGIDKKLSSRAQKMAAVPEAEFESMIGENLCRAELSPADRARQTARRKEIFETIHGPAKANSAKAANAIMGRGDKDVNANLADTFVEDTSQATGLSDRTVQRDAERGEKVSVKSEAEGRSGREGHCRQNYCASEYAAAG